jgi:hypothetical protein
MMMTSKIVAMTVMAAVLAMAGAARAGGLATVYTQNFESGTLGAEWSGAGTVESPEGLGAFGFGNWHLMSKSTAPSILTLTGLPPHSSLTLSFSLAIWDSVDAWQGDRFQVKVDGAFVIDEVFGNYVISDLGQSVGPGVPLTPPFTAYMAPNYGYGDFRDSARAVSITVPHSASTAILSFQYPAMQPWPDETFGLDNIVITVPCLLTADLSGDCFVDLEDLAVFASEWLRTDCVTPDWCGGADMDTTGDVGLSDLAELVSQWLTGIR